MATTGANGYAQIPYPIKLSPGLHPVTATYVAGTLSVTQGSTSTTPAKVETALGATTP